MVGLSVVLEAQKDIHKKAPQVISKASMNMIKPPSPASTSPSTSSSTTFNPFSRRSPSTLLSFPAAGFLECCFLCRQKLLPGRDIYMYKGDKAFCSEECRCRQIFMDEEETTATVKAKADYCSMAAIKPQTTPTSSSSSRCRKGARNRADGFAC